METRSEVAHAFYRALQEWDVQALLDLLSEDFEGEVTDGLPASLGGSYSGPNAMLADVWGRIGAMFATIRPEPAEYHEVEGDMMLVVGRYVGSAKRTGRELDAKFAHLLVIRGGRVRSLRQFTDSQRWVEALEG